MASFTSRSFRQLMGCFATGITVVTLKDSQLGRIGLTINSFTSVSLAPPLILFCLDKKAHLHTAFKRAEYFAINILSNEQRDISQHFANYRAFPEPKGIWDRPHLNCPVLTGTLGHIICERHSTTKGGDHTIFIGEVLALSQRKTAASPLLYFQSRYRNLRTLS